MPTPEQALPIRDTITGTNDPAKVNKFLKRHQLGDSLAEARVIVGEIFGSDVETHLELAYDPEIGRRRKDGTHLVLRVDGGFDRTPLKEMTPEDMERVKQQAEIAGEKLMQFTDRYVREAQHKNPLFFVTLF